MAESERMLTLAEATDTIRRVLDGIRVNSETVEVATALGRVVASDQASRVDLPPFDKSAMDGYALLADDERQEYQLLETVPAGCVPSISLRAGTAVKVMTGAPVPAGTGKVLRVECAGEIGETVRVHSHEKAENICRKGEDVARGDRVLRAGTMLGPLEIASLIACGITDVEVARRVRVAILSTGNEIVGSAEELVPGKIMDSNGPMLAALSDRYGLNIVSRSVVADHPDATRLALAQAIENADIVVLSGGVSMGDFDFVPAAMLALGLSLHFDRVAIKPGKPMTFASGSGTAVFGLPGNPVSAYLMFHLFVLPAARQMVGGPVDIRTVELPLQQAFRRRKTDRLAYIPCRLTQAGAVRAVEFHGSAHLQALLDSDGFFLVPVGVAELAAGQTVCFLAPEGLRS